MDQGPGSDSLADILEGLCYFFVMIGKWLERLSRDHYKPSGRFWGEGEGILAVPDLFHVMLVQ